MKSTYYILFAIFLMLQSCNSESTQEHQEGDEQESHDGHGHENEHGHEETVKLSKRQVEQLAFIIDSIPQRVMNSRVEASGNLEVPPHNEASVTAIIGGNVYGIDVIEGDDVKKGQVLAYLSHPELIDLQSSFQQLHAEVKYLKKEWERQKSLLTNGVNAGKTVEKIESEYFAKKGAYEGVKAKLELLSLSTSKIAEGSIYKRVPVISPINGSIKKVLVRTGQYVSPTFEMFKIVNNDHVHADLMVFEKDIYKIKEGQKIRFTVSSLPGRELTAKIYAIGKTFENDPKAVHIHADIENKEGVLLPGMYVRGQIITDSISTYSLPEDAVVTENGKSYIFQLKKSGEQFIFSKIEVTTGISSDGWLEIFFSGKVPKGKFAWAEAYLLLAEMQKSENEHSH